MFRINGQDRIDDMENSKRIETLESQISRVHCAIVHIKSQRRNPTPRQATIIGSLTFLQNELVTELWNLKATL